VVPPRLVLTLGQTHYKAVQGVSHPNLAGKAAVRRNTISKIEHGFLRRRALAGFVNPRRIDEHMTSCARAGAATLCVDSWDAVLYRPFHDRKTFKHLHCVLSSVMLNIDNSRQVVVSRAQGRRPPSIRSNRRASLVDVRKLSDRTPRAVPPLGDTQARGAPHFCIGAISAYRLRELALRLRRPFQKRIAPAFVGSLPRTPQPQEFSRTRLPSTRRRRSSPDPDPD